MADKTGNSTEALNALQSMCLGGTYNSGIAFEITPVVVWCSSERRKRLLHRPSTQLSSSRKRDDVLLCPQIWALDHGPVQTRSLNGPTGPVVPCTPFFSGLNGLTGTLMLRDDLDRIRIEVEVKEDQLSRKRIKLNHLATQLSAFGNEASAQDGTKTRLKKLHQHLSDEIQTLEDGIDCSRQEYAKLRNRLERVNAIKGFGSLPSLLLEQKAFASSSTPSSVEPMPTSSTAPAVPGKAVGRPAPNHWAIAPPAPSNEPGDHARRELVIRKVQNPQANTILSIPEAAHYFEVTRRTVHRWKDQGKLKSGARRGSITIKSIQHWENKRSRKRPSS